MKLNYKIINKDHYDIDAYSVFVDVTNEEQPGTAAYIELRYGIEETNLKVDISKGDPTYVDYGSTSVLYDDGTSLDAIDASEAVDLYDFFVCDEDLEPMHDEEKWNKQLYDSVMSETAKLLGGTVEEFKEAIYKVNEEVIKVVIKDIEEYYEINSDRIPDSVFERDEPDYDDWRDLDWE